MSTMRDLKVPVHLAWITGRSSKGVMFTGKELGIADVVMKSHDKRAALEAILARHKISLKEAAFIGDDLIDSSPDFRHLGEVREFDVAGPLRAIHRAAGVVAHDRELAGDARPGIGDQIFFPLPSGREDLKVLYPRALPARL